MCPSKCKLSMSTFQRVINFSIFRNLDRNSSEKVEVIMLTFGPRVGGFRKEKRAGLSNGEFSVEKKNS